MERHIDGDVPVCGKTLRTCIKLKFIKELHKIFMYDNGKRCAVCTALIKVQKYK